MQEKRLKSTKEKTEGKVNAKERETAYKSHLPIKNRNKGERKRTHLKKGVKVAALCWNVKST